MEFALISVPLFLILFGTIEFGWAFFQLNDVRHGAREGIRLVVVNADIDDSKVLDDGTTTWKAAVRAQHGSTVDTTNPAVYRTALFAQAACARMDESDGVSIQLVYSEADPSADANDAPEVGDDVEVRASKPLDQLTMVFDSVLGSVTLDETITSRLEQNPPTGVVAGTVYPDADGWQCRR